MLRYTFESSYEQYSLIRVNKYSPSIRRIDLINMRKKVFGILFLFSTNLEILNNAILKKDLYIKEGKGEIIISR